MPTYVYKCRSCDVQFEKILRVSESDQTQSCPTCGTEEALRVICPVGFVLKGDGWTGKNMKVNRQMMSRRGRLASKENEMKHDGPGISLAPNVEGERVASWSEAQRLARSRGKDATSYDAMVRKERQEG